MKFNTDLKIASYKNIVDEIIKGHYDDNGNYSPALGRIITMMLFYRACVTESRYTIDDKDQIASFDEVFEDPEFLRAFDKELRSSNRRNILSFNQAYFDAQKAIEAKNSSMATFVGSIVDVLTGAVNSLNEAFSDGTLETLSDIAKTYQGLNLDKDELTDMIVEKYAEKIGGDNTEEMDEADGEA